jgi:hypothetical protein
MAIFQGLAKGMTNAFMTPFLQRQQQDRQDERVRQQGALLKQGLSQFFGANSPEELALRQMPDEIIKDLANPMVGRYNTRLGYEREDTLTKEKQAYTENQTAADRARKRQTQRSLFNTVSHGMGDRIFVDPASGQEKDIELDPGTMSYYLKNFDDRDSVDKLNAWARSLYPDWKDAPTSQAVMDAVNNRQSMAQNTEDFEQRKKLIDYEADSKRNKDRVRLVEQDLSPYARNTVLRRGREILAKDGLTGLQESLSQGELKALTDYLTDEEDLVIGRILMMEAAAPKSEKPKAESAVDKLKQGKPLGYPNIDWTQGFNPNVNTRIK